MGSRKEDYKEEKKEKLKIPMVVELRKWLDYNKDKDIDKIDYLLNIPIDKLTTKQKNEIKKYDLYYKLSEWIKRHNNILPSDLKYIEYNIDEEIINELMISKLSKKELYFANKYIKNVTNFLNNNDLIETLSQMIKGNLDNYQVLSMRDSYIYHMLYNECFNKKTIKTKLLKKISKISNLY